MIPAVLLSLLIGCTRPLPDGSMEDDDFLIEASEVRATLEAPCANAIGGNTRYEVSIDDRSGHTVLLETDADRVWLRDPFGTVSDRCWWLPPAGSEDIMPEQPCTEDGMQDGTCTSNAQAPSGWTFFTPGVAVSDATIADIMVEEGTLVAVTNSGFQRLDLMPTSDPPASETETVRTWLQWLPAIALPREDLGTGQVAAMDDAYVAYSADRGTVWFFNPTAQDASLSDHQWRRSAPENGILAAAGNFAVIASEERVHIWSRDEDRLRRDRHGHSSLKAGVFDVAVHPVDGTAYVLVPDGVVQLRADGELGYAPAPGAEGLFVGHPGGSPLVYAWGNDDDGGVLYRLEAGNVSSAAHIDGQLLGAGTGSVFQEIVIVTANDDGAPTVRGMLDRHHLDAIPPGTVGIAFAAFIESPRDADLDDPTVAHAELELIGGCQTTPPEGLESEHQLCCAQEQRGLYADTEFEWLDRRMTSEWQGGPMAVVVGVNPSAVELSRQCSAVADATVSAMADALPSAVASWLGSWEERGVGAAATFGHSAPFSADAWWVSCPESWLANPDETCWDFEPTEDAFFAFYQRVAEGASLAPWGTEPDWQLFGGPYPEAILNDEFGWPDIFGDILLADGQPTADLYFGNLAMDPRTPAGVAKELAPDDARDRAFPVLVNAPADRWDEYGIPTGDRYWPGQTVALSYLYERHRAGLLFSDYDEIVSVQTDWSSDLWRGDESEVTLDHADFALEEHYLITRVVAHRNATTPRWWYFHLHDLSRIRATGLGSGLVQCASDCATDTELDRFLVRLESWAPAVVWRATPE